MEKKKTSIFLKIIIVLVVLLVLFRVSVSALSGFLHGKIYEKEDEVSQKGNIQEEIIQEEETEKENTEEESVTEERVTNILLIGSDERENLVGSRSDAMILLSVNEKTKTVHLISIMRDIYVEIPGYDDNRINAAFAFGGPKLLMETVEKNFGMEVDRYVLVDFQAFEDLIDAVGGVDLELTKEEVQYIRGLDAPEGGMVHLNGSQALSYCRNRSIGRDFGRTERQRKVLSAVIKNAPKAMILNPGKLLELVSQLTTNLTESEFTDLFLKVPKFLSYEVVQGRIPIDGTYKDVTIRQMAVLEIDFEKNMEYLKTEIYGE